MQSCPFQRWRLALALLLAACAPSVMLAAPPALAQTESIAAVVNGAVISRGDVDNRARLFALSAGVTISPELLDRLKPQILNQLVDEKLRLQAIEAAHITVPDQAIAAAITSIGEQNHLAPGELRARLSGQGVALRTLIDQIRVELGWTELLRHRLGPQARVTPAEIAGRLAQLQAEEGQTEYLVSEIFIPIDNPAKRGEAEKFASTVIGELRAGAPFGVVAAQFSQSQTALQGGTLGWVQANQLDPQVVALVNAMPPGAISDPIPVAGGLEIVALAGRRPIGGSVTEMVTLRQVYLPFVTKFNPAAPTAAQRALISRAHALGGHLHSCDEMEAANKEAGSKQPADPGPVVLSAVTPPAFQSLLRKIPLSTVSQPLISNDGVAVIMVCSRGMQNPVAPSSAEIARAILDNRAELLSRQMLADLRRRAVIEIRSS
ncbi:MAG: peptidylprolyl isomerase [Acetobacteraceae bacterium]